MINPPILQPQNSSKSQKIVVTLPSSFYYTLVNNNRDLLQTGPLEVIIVTIGQCEMLKLQIGHVVISLQEDWKIVKSEYQDTVGYYLIDSFDNLTALVVEKSNPNRINFEGYLKGFVVVLEKEEVEKNDRLIHVLKNHWKYYDEKAPISADGLQKFISLAGHGLGKSIVTVGAKISNYWNKNKSEQIVEVREQPSWYDRLKNKTGRFFSKTGEVIKPVIDPIVKKSKEYNEKIGDKIDQGDSKVMKYIKDVASVSTEAFKNMYIGAKAAASGKDTFYSESNAPTDYRQSSPQKQKATQQQQSSEQDSRLDLLQKPQIRDQLLDK